METAQELQRKLIILAAANFLSEQEEGDLYDAYIKLCDADDAGAGKDLASNYVSIWQPLEYMNVSEILELIDSAIENLENSVETAPDFIKKIDWKALKGQKKALLETINNDAVDPEHKEGLEGILALLDNLQDFAVDSMGLDENDVFELIDE